MEPQMVGKISKFKLPIPMDSKHLKSRSIQQSWKEGSVINKEHGKALLHTDNGPRGFRKDRGHEESPGVSLKNPESSLIQT